MNKIFDLQFLISVIPDIIKFLPVTLLLALLSCLLGLVIGFLVALVRYFKVKGLLGICKVYISFIRGTPTMVQLVLVYYGLPIVLRYINSKWGTAFDVNSISPILFAIITFSFNAGAYMSEIIRSAMLAVDRGQIEACYSMNMSSWQTLKSVIMPQAFGIALPSLGNNFISVLKETSLVFNISVVEIMSQAKIIGSRTFRFFEVYIAVSLIYWGCCLGLEFILNRIEKKVRTKERGV